MFKPGETFIEILLHERRLKTYTSELSLEELSEAIQKLTRVFEQRQKEASEKELAAQRKRQHIEEIQRFIKDNGLDPADVVSELGGGTAHGSRSSKSAQAKYACTDEYGNVVTWSGKGRRPKAFNDKIEAGAKIEDFKLPN